MSVFAHGEHGDAAPPAGASPVTIDGFQVELLTSPEPPRVGEPSRIVAKILRRDTMEPVRNGKVSIGVAPIEPVASTAAPNGHGGHAMLDPGISLFPVVEMTWSGSYTLERTLEESGPYKVRVALAELDGKTFDRPSLIDFQVNVVSAGSLSPVLIFAGFDPAQPADGHAPRDVGVF